MWERIGVKPCIEGGRIRQYTAAAGAPMVYGFKAFECEGKLELVLRGRALGCIARASALEGRIRSKYEADSERGHSYEAMDGSTVLQDSVGALKRGRRSGPASTSSLLAVQVARDMGPLPRIKLEKTTVEVAYDNHKTLNRYVL